MDGRAKEVYLVLGGSGLLGRHIVERLRDRGDTVAVLDLVQRHDSDDIPFYSGDIAEKDVVLSVVKKVCIITTCSFRSHTRALISAVLPALYTLHHPMLRPQLHPCSGV